MAKLSEHTSAESAHILAIGNNGSGKTGALVSLAKAGYNVRVLDYDRGTEILAQLLANDPAAMDRVDVETFVDKYAAQVGTGTLKATQASNAFEMSMKCLANWPGHGSPATWGPETVLVIDSLTFQGKAAMNHVFKIKNKLTSLDPKDVHPSQPDWGDAMGLQENLMAMLMGLKCHVIVNAHVTFVTNEGELQAQGFPSALGSKLPPKIGSYFNTQLFFTKAGVGSNKRRIISTKSTGLVETKTPAPGKVKDEYPIETGLAQYFADLGFIPPAAATKAA